MKRKQWSIFEPSYCVSPADSRRHFVNTKTSSTHQPMLKKLIPEIWFLSEHYNDQSKYVFVYAGSSGMDARWKILITLFPKLRGVVFDPLSKLKPNAKLQVIKAPLNESTKEKIGLKEDEFILFVCHWYTLEEQMACVRLLNPFYSMLTLKLPFQPGQTPFFAPYKPDQIRYSAFAQHDAADVRVVVNFAPAVILYDNQFLEERCCFYNTVTRIQRYTPFPPLSDWGRLKIDFCGDCCQLMRTMLNLLGRIRYGRRVFVVGDSHTVETLLPELPFPNAVARVIACFAGVAEASLFKFVERLFATLQIHAH